MSRTPQYVELADRLQARWASMPPGTLVESEHRLAAEFDVNRLTAREAVRELERRMVVRRVMGRGTFTAHRIDYEIRLGDVASFRRKIIELGHEPRSTVISSEWSGRGPTRHLTVSRVSSVDGFPATASVDVFPSAVGKRIAASVTDGCSLHELMGDTGFEPRRAEVRVSVEIPDLPFVERLDFSSVPAPTWRVLSVTVDRPTDEVIHRSETWMRTDMFAVSVLLGSAG